MANFRPYDARVEYLACTTDNQYINTGYYPSNKTKIMSTCMFFVQDSRLCAARWASGGGAINNVFGFYNSSSNLVAANYHNGTNKNTNILNGDSRRLNNILDIKYDYLNASITVDLSGTRIATAGLSTSYTFTATQPLMLFAFADLTTNKAVRIYSFQIYDNNTLVHDYIPVRKGQVGYLYDLVTNELKGNDGSGSFVYGNDIII